MIKILNLLIIIGLVKWTKKESYILSFRNESETALFQMI